MKNNPYHTIKVAIIAPSFDQRPEALEISKQNLTQAFLETNIRIEFVDFLPDSQFYDNKSVFDNGRFSQELYNQYQSPHLAKRAEKIHEAFESDCHLIWATMGGTGTAAMVKSHEELLRSARITSPKLLLGYSDTTALHNFCLENYPDLIIPVQAPGFIDFSYPHSQESYKKFVDDLCDSIVNQNTCSYQLEKLNNVEEEAAIEGQSIGGSLSMYIDDRHIRGYEGSRPEEPDFRPYIPWSPKIAENKIFFLEPHNLDICTTQLNKYPNFFSGTDGEIFGKAKAIIFGNFGNYDETSRQVIYKTNEELQNELSNFLSVMTENKIPVYIMSGASFGHNTIKEGKSEFIPLILSKAFIKNGKVEIMPVDVLRVKSCHSEKPCSSVEDPTAKKHNDIAGTKRSFSEL